MAELDTSKINEILNYYGLKTNIEETKKWVKQYVDGALTGITTDLMANVTYSELVSLRDNNNLKPGMLYRMTDYVTKVYDEDGEITSAEHPFDLILTAINENTLDENCRVALHDGDEYFSECKVEAWEVKYCLDNDTTRFKYCDGGNPGFSAIRTTSDWDGSTYIYKRYSEADGTGEYEYYAWAYVYGSDDRDLYDDTDINWNSINSSDLIYTNSELPNIGNYFDDGGGNYFEIIDVRSEINSRQGNGKGYIYYMKDEWDNEAPYDFKNILQKDMEYTFGNNEIDYSLFGNINCVYGNKIMLAIDCETNQEIINKIRIVNENSHSNVIKPSCQNSYIDFDIDECDISMNDDGELVVFKTQDFVSGIENHTIEHDYRKDYLTFEAVNDDTEIIFKTYTDDPQYTKTIEVSKDKVNWETKTSSSEGVILTTLNAGECLYLRGNNSSYAYYDENEGEYLPNFMLPLNDCYVYGNVMSLIDSNNFRTLTEITDDYALYSLFYDYRNEDYSGEYLLSHPDKKLVLPATTLANNCYCEMFYNCTSLTTSPKLPATTLADYCYSNMFLGCTALETAPELPATTLAFGCYQCMFYNCSSLTTAPKLQATTLAGYCYNNMFFNCSSLTTAPKLSATTLASSCYSGMFNDCISLTEAPVLPATTLAQSCYVGMFRNCTSLTSAPELPATSLADGCYSYMFSDCTSLTSAPELPATTLAYGCYYYMFSNCSSLNYVKCLAVNGINENYNTYQWVYGVASSGTFVKHPDAMSWPTGDNGIPTNWTVEDAVIE